jgi:acyl-CoA thioesterase
MSQLNPEQFVSHMWNNDHFSQWLDIKILDIKPNFAKLSLRVRKDMLNGFGILHGGVSFSLADSAFAFAANSSGQLTVSLNALISFPKPAYVDDIIIAETQLISDGNKTAVYDVNVFNQITNDIIATFRATAFKTGKPVIPI